VSGGGRPLPHPTELSAPHWEGAKHRRLMVQRCAACGAYNFIPRHTCTECFTDRLDWVESSGRGVVYSYTVIHRAPHPSFETPYCAAIIQLDEGWYMLSNIVGSAMAEIAVGRRAKVDFLDLGDVTLPVFRLEATADAAPDPHDRAANR
jgi:uncharacterized OB-fold protein